MVCEKCQAKMDKESTSFSDKKNEINNPHSIPFRLSSKNQLAAYSNKCVLCKSQLYQKNHRYCQGCAFKNGICSICGTSIHNITLYRQRDV